MSSFPIRVAGGSVVGWLCQLLHFLRFLHFPTRGRSRTWSTRATVRYLYQLTYGVVTVAILSQQLSSCIINSIFSPATTRCRIFIPTAMAPPGLRSLFVGAVACLPALAMAYANASYSSLDMLRAQMALMDNRPDGCPPW